MITFNKCAMTNTGPYGYGPGVPVQRITRGAYEGQHAATIGYDRTMQEPLVVIIETGERITIPSDSFIVGRASVGTIVSPCLGYVDPSTIDDPEEGEDGLCCCTTGCCSYCY